MGKQLAVAAMLFATFAVWFHAASPYRAYAEEAQPGADTSGVDDALAATPAPAIVPAPQPPNEMTLAVWTHGDQRARSAEPPPEPAWRTSFGSERRTDPLDLISAAIVDADIIAVRRIGELNVLFKLFPAREFFVIPSLALRRSALERETPDNAELAAPVGVAVAIRRGSGLRATRTLQAAELSDGVAEQTKDALAVEVRIGRLAFWLVVTENAPASALTGRMPDASAILFVSSVHAGIEPHSSDPSAVVKLPAPTSVDSKCLPPPLHLAHREGTAPRPHWEDHASWVAPAGEESGQDPCIALLGATLPHGDDESSILQR